MKTVTKETIDETGKKIITSEITTETTSQAPGFIKNTLGNTKEILKKTPKKVIDVAKKVPDFVTNIDDAGNSLIKSSASTSNPFKKIADLSFAIPFKFTSGSLKFTAGVFYSIANVELPTIINNIFLRNQTKKVGEKLILPIIVGTKKSDFPGKEGNTIFKIELVDKPKLQIDATWWGANSVDLAIVQGSQQDLVNEINDMSAEDKAKILSTINKVLDLENISSDADKDAKQRAVLLVLNKWGTIDEMYKAAGLSVSEKNSSASSSTLSLDNWDKKESSFNKSNFNKTIVDIMDAYPSENSHIFELVNDLPSVKAATEKLAAIKKVFENINSSLMSLAWFKTNVDGGKYTESMRNRIKEELIKIKKQEDAAAKEKVKITH